MCVFRATNENDEEFDLMSACCVNETNFFFAKKTRAKKHSRVFFPFFLFFFQKQLFEFFCLSQHQTVCLKTQTIKHASLKSFLVPFVGGSSDDDDDDDND